MIDGAAKQINLQQALDVLDDVANSSEALGLAKVDALCVFELADELDHIQRIDVERFQRGFLGDGARIDGEVVFENLLDGIDDCHDNPFKNPQASGTDYYPPSVLASMRCVMAQPVADAEL